MSKRSLLTGICALFISFSCSAQVPKSDTLIKKLDSLARKTDSAGTQVNNIDPYAYNEVTKLTPRSYFILLGSDIKQQLTKPFHMTKKDWVRFGKFAVVTGAMMFADETIQKNALDLRERSKAVRNTGKYVTEFGRNYEFIALGGFFTYGLIFKSQKVKTTALLATQAVITGGITESLIKTLTGRTRPNYYPAGKEAEPTFLGPFGKTGKDALGKRSNSSFPSGHTTAAFAAATVFAVEYRNKPIIPITAYTIASLVGISRITENKHWTTDVIAGAALGYLTGRQVALNYHRYAKIQNAEARKKITFNLQYHFGRMMPGLVYDF